ncbi:MAG: cobalt-precorrin-6A reductase [Elainellaceae cyanobacterium]
MMTKSPLWLIGGTQESVVLAERLLNEGCSLVVTVTTEAARSLYPHHDRLTLQVGSLSAATLPAFLQSHGIRAVLDASHPFAVQISQLAIATAQAHQIPYLRFERTALEHSQPQNSSVLTLSSVETLVSGSYLEPTTAGQQHVLLTLGYRMLPLFQPWQSRATLFARILPSPIALSTALDSGFTPDRLIALRPPISPELERSLWQQWRITTVVTKASGQAGGEDVKRAIAQELGVRLILLERPAVTYPAQTQDLEEAIAWSCDRLSASQ